MAGALFFTLLGSQPSFSTFCYMATGPLPPAQTLRLSQPEDMQQDTAQWYHILSPPVGYLVVRSDLDTISFEDHPMMHEPLEGFKVLLHIFCTVGHLRGVRSPLYHLTASLRCAQKQAAFGTKKWQQFQNSTIVALDL